MSVVLVDMDGTIADWGAEYDRQLDLLGDIADGIRRTAQQTSFDLHEGATPDESGLIRAIMDLPGFYAGLEEIDGAFVALEEMLAAGHEVFIVTSPWLSNDTCASEKLAWMRARGEHWGERTIITRDKTTVRGDVLFDDKPRITGAMAPTWEHVAFAQPCNVGFAGRRITHWSQWRDFVEPKRAAA